MNMRDKQHIAGKMKSKANNVKAAQKFASRSVNTVESARDTAQRKAEMVKDSVIRATRKFAVNFENAVETIKDSPESKAETLKDLAVHTRRKHER